MEDCKELGTQDDWAMDPNRSAGHPFLLLLILVASLSLLARINDVSLDLVEESLWYEDANIFANQAYELGVQSLWEPYAGYQLLFPRIVALIASHAPLVATPYIFFSAWLLSFFSIAWALSIRGQLAGLNKTLLAFLVSAIALQPSHGEAFFNLNHSHYFLGIALALYLCIPSRSSPSIAQLSFLLIACLTGPFFLPMTVILFLQLVALRDFRTRKSIYLIVGICGIIQAIFLLLSHRIQASFTGAMITTHVISTLLFFGGNDNLTRFSAAALWAIMLIFAGKTYVHAKSHRNGVRWIPPVSATIGAILFFVAGMASSSELLHVTSPFEMGSRYFLVPYSLLFFAALAFTQRYRAAQTAVVALISTICAAGLVLVDRPDRASPTGLLSRENLQWVAFAKFHAIKPEIAIPTNGALPVYPPLNAVFAKREHAFSDASIAAYEISPSQPYQSADLASGANASGSTYSANFNPAVHFDIGNYCAEDKYLALEIEIWRARMGWASIYWGKLGNFEPKRSLRRFYLDGHTTMQFAFRRDIGDQGIRFHPAQGVSDSAVVHTLHNYGFEEWLARAGITVAVPTEPGGEFRIDRVRLFCLQ
jgi:hypothetical protein